MFGVAVVAAAEDRFIVQVARAACKFPALLLLLLDMKQYETIDKIFTITCSRSL